MERVILNTLECPSNVARATSRRHSCLAETRQRKAELVPALFEGPYEVYIYFIIQKVTPKPSIQHRGALV
jgi:hypothetical protein